MSLRLFSHQKQYPKKGKSSVILILGGAVGNGIDRIANNYVVDFIDFYFNDFHWPAFNFADLFITVGGIFIFGLYYSKIMNEID